MGDSIEIRFDVSYNAREYRSFVVDYVSRQGHARTRAARLAVALFASAVFPFKLLRVGRCRFHIDESGISRQSERGGVVKYGWIDLTECQALSHGLLLVFPRGAMPIPYRCLTASEIAFLRGIAVNASRSSPGGAHG